MKQHQNSPSLSLSPPPCCKCSNQDSKQLIVSRLRDRERELVCQGLQNLPSKRGAFEEFHCIPQRPWRGDVPWFALAGACPKILKTLSRTALFRFSSSSHSLQTAARPSSQRYGTIQPRRVKCKLPWQLTLPMMLFLRSFLPSFLSATGGRQRERKRERTVLRLGGTEGGRRWTEKARNSAIGHSRGAEFRGKMRDWRTKVRGGRERARRRTMRRRLGSVHTAFQVLSPKDDMDAYMVKLFGGEAQDLCWELDLSYFFARPNSQH